MDKVAENVYKYANERMVYALTHAGKQYYEAVTSDEMHIVVTSDGNVESQRPLLSEIPINDVFVTDKNTGYHNLGEIVGTNG